MMYYDINANEYTNIYNYEGQLSKNKIDVTTYYCSDKFKRNALLTYKKLCEKRSELKNTIAFIIDTDQHGRVLQRLRYIQNIDNIGMYKINLGDTVTDYYNTRELNTALEQLNNINNYIAVVGNHDAITKGSENANNDDLKNYFKSTYITDVENHKVDYYAIDDKVKILVLCPYYMLEDGTRNGVEIKTDQMTWLINQLKTSEKDIIILNHQQFTDNNIHRDNSLQDWFDAPQVLKDIRTMLESYNEHKNGSITDSEGITHNYDFTNKTNKILVTLHGHSHEELYLVKNKLTSYVADWVGNNNCCTFGLIDKNNDRVFIYHFNENKIDNVLLLPI